MRANQIINRLSSQHRLLWLFGLLCCAIALIQPSLAAEVQPSAIEVVGEPNSRVPIAPSGPPSPADTFAQAVEPVWSDMQIAGEDAGHYSPPIGEAIINSLLPILAVSLIFGGPILLIIVLATLRYRTRERRENIHAENIAKLIEAGRDVPLEMLQGSVGGKIQGKADDNLRDGIKNVGVGTGLLIFLTLFLGIKIGSVGFIIIGYGLSQLAVWKFVDSKAAPRSIGVERD